MKRRYVVDLDALAEKRAKLTKALENLTALEELIGDMDHVEATAPTQPPSQKQLPLTPLSKKTGRPMNRSFTIGQRRVLILHLFTGPATEHELLRALGWPLHKVHGAIHCAVRDQLVCALEGKPNFYTLTMKGKMAAEFFQRNPSYVSFRPTGWTK